MNSPERVASPLRAALVLAVFAALTSGAVALVKHHSSERIAANQKQAREQRLAQILPQHVYDNRPGEDHVLVSDPLLGMTPQPVYRARRAGEPAASGIQVTAHNGYNGDIVLLVGVDRRGNVLSVRTLRHRETPGLGDGIDITRDDWITSFDGISLAAADAAWAVRRDGGQFDQLSGATVTSRAVIGAVRNALLYFDRHRNWIFSTPGEQ